MNLADRTPLPMHPDATPTPNLVAPPLDEVMARLAVEVSMPLTQALARVATMASTGRIDRPSLEALRAEIGEARRAGLRSQQIARFAAGQARPGIERVALAQVLRAVLTDQALRAPAGSVGHRQALAEVDVMGDASLLHTLLQAAADWGREHARSSVDWRLEMLAWPVQARLTCRFHHRPGDTGAAAETGADDAAAPDTLDTLDWLLMQYAAHLAGVTLLRELSGSVCLLTLVFPHIVNDTLEGASAVELGSARGGTVLAAGSQVLVLATRREARQRVREALHGHELFIDYVASVAAAHDYCQDGAPQALVYESTFEGELLRALRAQLALARPQVAMIEVTPSGTGCEIGPLVTRIGADGLGETLGSVLLMDLARRD